MSSIRDLAEGQRIADAACAYKDAWLKLQDGAEGYSEKQADIARMYAAQHYLFDVLGGREVTLNRGLMDPKGWWCKCGNQHDWDVGACPSGGAPTTAEHAIGALAGQPLRMSPEEAVRRVRDYPTTRSVLPPTMHYRDFIAEVCVPSLIDAARDNATASVVFIQGLIIAALTEALPDQRPLERPQ